MSTMHMAYDDYGFPHSSSPHPPSYDISYGLGGVPLHSSYPPSHLDASTSAHHGLLSSQLSQGPSYSSFYPAQHDHYAAQPYLSEVGNGMFDPHSSMFTAAAHRQPSPRPHAMYDAGRPSSSNAPPSYAPPPSEWNGNVHYPTHYDPVGSAAAYSQQANLAPQPPQQQHLSGSLDPTTGEFHRTVEHPRLRTAQACEKCRIRKAKCTGDSPCSRCLSRGLQCEYAPERKMRGPNKNKRGDTAKAKPRKGKESPPAEPLDSASEGHASDNSPPPSRRCESSSTHSSPVPPHRELAPQVRRGRPRAATLGLGAIGRLSQFNHPPTPQPPGSDNTSVPAARPRPPPLNLTSEREYVPRMLAQYAGAPAPVPFPENSNPRPDLPSYLIDSYSRIALRPGEDGSPQSSGYDSRPRSQDISSLFGDSPASAYSQSRTSSSSAMSTPISPMSLNFENDLQYPLPNDFGHFGDGAPEHPFGGDVHMYGGGHDDLLRPKSAHDHCWDAALSNEDRTPRSADMGNMYP
ncbi:hypothetical protein L227DRAFT_566174 [Lentinus tigrinus ALCF2SS1-6]|uniref:Zn(2)-C6 fungal-type domain-containing protein n=1 Tax=Lentinus tigrinus ALCF2SS1-6 TaxID=1328759 RepID=A0A5C2RZ19_9APHY|nr:hypothetical protein L227DRAFT_566174 [Lentinus tigrinus ALCF2SS1-6]